MSTTKQAISLWFPQYRRWLAFSNITHGDYVWNVDEKPILDLLAEGGSIVVRVVGEKPMQIVGGEKAVNSTLLTYTSGSRIVCPPMLILKGQKVQTVWRDAMQVVTPLNAPPPMYLAASDKGYISTQKFHQYSQFFYRVSEGEGAHWEWSKTSCTA